MTAATPTLSARVSLPPHWVEADLARAADAPVVPWQSGQRGTADLADRLARARLRRSLSNAGRAGLVHLSTWSAAAPGGDQPMIHAGLAITCRRLDQLDDAEQRTNASPNAPSLDMLRAAIMRADRTAATSLRPLEPPAEVLLRNGFGLRRGALMRVVAPTTPLQDGVVLVDRFMVTTNDLLVTADFHTPNLGLHRVLRPHFAHIAMTIEVEHAD